MPKLGGVLSKLVQLKRIIDRGHAAEPPEALKVWGRIFVIFREKIAILTPFRSQFARF